MSGNNCQPEENEKGAWRAMPIEWLDTESFAPRLALQRISPREILWLGHDTQWATPLIKSGETNAFWAGCFNFTADAK